ncbi:MAG: hypothetical protein R3336_06730, partial [Phycisphaeraceae bacterium]|nr:hypothetical protein [Phycisphaeraceae bacterium]
EREQGQLHQNQTYRLARVETIAGIPVATVTMTADLSLTPKDPPEGAPPMQVRMTDGSHQAEILWDLQRGEAVGRNAVESRRIETTIQLPNGRSLKRLVDERVQSQALRIAEGEE